VLVNPLIRLGVDSTSAIGFTSRRGPGALKHISLKYMSIQDDVRQKVITVEHIPAIEIVSDFLTKPSSYPKLEQFMQKVNLVCEVQTEVAALEPATHFGEICMIMEEPERQEEQRDEKLFWTVFYMLVALAVVGGLTLCQKVWRLVMWCRRRTLQVRDRIVYPQATTRNRGTTAMATRE
jgi:hypothetical protein